MNTDKNSDMNSEKSGDNNNFSAVNNEPFHAACHECGAVLHIGESCAGRFAILLALDHSRQEPWGSRHGLAFAVYSLQHPESAARATLVQGWAILNRVYRHGDDRADVVRGLRGAYRARHEKGYDKSNATLSEAWSGVPLPAVPAPRNFAVTIHDLGNFEAGTYAAQLDAWCIATLNAWESVGRDKS